MELRDTFIAQKVWEFPFFGVENRRAVLRCQRHKTNKRLWGVWLSQMLGDRQRG